MMLDTSEILDYKKSGVNREAGDFLVEKIKKIVGRTYDQRVKAGVGGFASLYDIGQGKYLAAGTDGVGTKLKLACELNIHHTIGFDLVAMCVNDILCTGARPLFFLDYFATGKLEVEVAEKVISGIGEACLQSQMALIGGETAEMPGMYQAGEYDLAGFAVGEVYKDQLLDGLDLEQGDSLISLVSSGAHSNGFSLIRKLLEKEKGQDKKRWGELALTPTSIYTSFVLGLLEKFNLKNEKKKIKGLAHITGSGLYNIARINNSFNYHLTALPSYSQISPLFEWIKKSSNLSSFELYQTFNMGLGLVIATSSPHEVLDFCKNQKTPAFLIGEVKKGSGKVVVESHPHHFTLE